MHPVPQAENVDPERDVLLPLYVALAFLPSRPSPPTLWRWRVKGVNGVNGVKLRCIRCGHLWMTKPSFVQEFLRAQTAACDEQSRDAADIVPAERSQRKTGDLRKARLLDDNDSHV